MPSLVAVMEMDATDNTSSELSNFTVSEDIIGPFLATVVLIEMLLALLANSFISVFTLCNPKSLLKPSTIFLLSLSLSNLIMSALFMPFTVITAGVGEWVFGASAAQKSSVCKYVAFVFSLSVSASVHALPAISFDRFLLIVKPLRHRQIMKPWVALLMVLGIWLVSVLFNITPFIGLGEYAFSPPVASCIPIWGGHADYVLYITLESTIPLGIILVTTIWTFLFTRRFITQDYKRQRGGPSQDDNSVQKQVYNHRLRNLIGIFGMLLVVNMISFLPFIVTSIVGFVVGFSSLPAGLYAAVFTLFLLNNVTNPLVQSYFRRELWESVVLFGKRMRKCLSLASDGDDLAKKRTSVDNHSSRSAGMNMFDNSIHVQAKENGLGVSILPVSVVHEEEAMELNTLPLPEQVGAASTAHNSNCVEKTRPKMTVQNNPKIPSYHTDASSEDANKSKSDNRISFVKNKRDDVNPSEIELAQENPCTVNHKDSEQVEISMCTSTSTM